MHTALERSVMITVKETARPVSNGPLSSAMSVRIGIIKLCCVVGTLFIFADMKIISPLLWRETYLIPRSYMSTVVRKYTKIHILT